MANTVENKKITRNSSIELLRIISMFLIVICHFSTHGSVEYGNQVLSIPRFWMNIIKMGGNLGVNVFMIISGYFLVTNTSGVINTKKVLKFWGQLFFYSVVCYLFFVAYKQTSFSLGSFFKTFLPVTLIPWWFATGYFMVYVTHPYLNILIHKLNKNTYRNMLMVMLTLWCIIPSITPTNMGCNNYVWLFILYLVAGYIRLYGLNEKITTKRWALLAILFISLRCIACILLTIAGIKSGFAASHQFTPYIPQSILTFIASTSLFMLFINLKVKYNYIINLVASSTFGVYLISENSYVREFLWKNLFDSMKFKYSVFIIVYSIIAAIVVFIVCSIIDLLRKVTIEKVYIKIIDRYSDSLEKKAKIVINRIKMLVFGQ